MWMLTPSVLIENLIYYAIGAFSLWKGGSAERWAAAALLIDNTIGFFIFDAHHPRLEGPRYTLLALDVVVMLVMLRVAFTTDLRWALLASALQILSMLTFVARIIDPTIHSWAYVTVDIAISFALQITVAFGAAMHGRRSRGSRPTGSGGP